MRRRLRTRELGEVGGQKGVDPFLGKPELMCKKRNGSGVPTRSIASSIGVWPINTVADHLDRNIDARIT